LKNRKGGEKGKNMKDQKFCFSRTLVYLVLLVAVLVGGVYMVRYMNNQITSRESRAAGDCNYTYNGVKYLIKVIAPKILIT
jgi:hypothetical protein